MDPARLKSHTSILRNLRTSAIKTRHELKYLVQDIPSGKMMNDLQLR